MRIEPNNIYQGDCRELLRLIPDNTIDCVVSDVAYKITSRGSASGMGGFMAEKSSMNGRIFKSNNIEIEDYLPDLYRVLKDGTHCYLMCNNINLPHFLDVISKSDFHFIKCLIWDKCSRICGTFYMGSFEYIIMLSKGRARTINDCSTPDILSVPIPKNKAKDKLGLINPTQKPQRLFEILARNSTNKGDVVLDPMAGSCTLARACVNLDRQYICFDIDERQVEWAKRDLAMHARQLSLF